MRVAGDTSLATGERSSLSDPFIEKIEEWVDRSQGRVRASLGSCRKPRS